MSDDKNKDDEFNSALEAEGIVIENEQTESKDEKLKTEDIEKEIFNAVGAKIEKTTEIPDEPITDDVKKELNDGGIELLPPEPTDSDQQ